jgi:Ca2+-binding RTX toxin-like protein
VTVDLASGAPAGEAGEGDSLVSVESVSGGSAGDTLRGTDGFNSLTGRDGDDTLDGRGGGDGLFSGDGDDTVIGGAGDDDIETGAGDDTIRLENPPGTYDRIVVCDDGDDSVGDLVEPFPSVGLDCERLNIGGGIVVPVAPKRVTSTYIQMSIPCPAAYRDSNGVCAGKLQVEPRLAFKRSATTRYRQRYGATAFRFTTGSARILVRLNAAGRKEIAKSVARMQFTLRLTETATGQVRELAWTETMSRFYMRRLGILR